MYIPNSPVEVRAKVQEYILLAEDEQLPLVLRKQLAVVLGYPSPVDFCVCFAELVYAAGTLAPPGLQDIAAGAAEFCGRMGWHGLDTDARGNAICQALRGGTATAEPLQKYADAFLTE